MRRGFLGRVRPVCGWRTAAMNPSTNATRTRRPNLKSGVYTLRKAVQVLGSRALPTKRTALGRALHEWRTSPIADLGGSRSEICPARLAKRL